MIQPFPVGNILVPRHSRSGNSQSGIPQQVPDTGISHIGAGFDPRPRLVSDPGGVGHDQGVDIGGCPAVEVFTLIKIFVGIQLGGELAYANTWRKNELGW